MTQAPEYRLVPVEPTEAMLEAASGHPMLAITREAYAAMLAAAPHTAAPAADRAVSELSRDPDGDIAIDWQTPDGQMLSMALSRAGRLAVAVHAAGVTESCTVQIPSVAFHVLDVILDAADRALAPPADRAELVEAVAWLKGNECNVGPRSAKSIAIVLDALARSTDAPTSNNIPNSEHLAASVVKPDALATPPAAATSTPCASGEGAS